MVNVAQLIVLSALLVAPIDGQEDRNSMHRQADMAGYNSLPLWQEDSLFPRWQDTYAIIFEQEMLA